MAPGTPAFGWCSVLIAVAIVPIRRVPAGEGRHGSTILPRLDWPHPKRRPGGSRTSPAGFAPLFAAGRHWCKLLRPYGPLCSVAPWRARPPRRGVLSQRGAAGPIVVHGGGRSGSGPDRPNAVALAPSRWQRRRLPAALAVIGPEVSYGNRAWRLALAAARRRIRSMPWAWHTSTTGSLRNTGWQQGRRSCSPTMPARRELNGPGLNRRFRRRPWEIGGSIPWLPAFCAAGGSIPAKGPNRTAKAPDGQ